MKRYLLIFKGQVQGVGFRYTACQIANKLGLVGYVENLDNGDVKVEVEGKQYVIDTFIKQILNSSNHWIRVDDYALKEIELKNNETVFSYRY